MYNLLENDYSQGQLNSQGQFTIKLFEIADKYWIIDMWPNLKCRFAMPTIIFSLFKIFIYGKWYNPESGL